MKSASSIRTGRYVSRSKQAGVRHEALAAIGSPAMAAAAAPGAAARWASPFDRRRLATVPARCVRLGLGIAAARGLAAHGGAVAQLAADAGCCAAAGQRRTEPGPVLRHAGRKTLCRTTG